MYLWHVHRAFVYILFWTFYMSYLSLTWEILGQVFGWVVFSDVQVTVSWKSHVWCPHLSYRSCFSVSHLPGTVLLFHLCICRVVLFIYHFCENDICSKGASHLHTLFGCNSVRENWLQLYMHIFWLDMLVLRHFIILPCLWGGFHVLRGLPLNFILIFCLD